MAQSRWPMGLFPLAVLAVVLRLGAGGYMLGLNLKSGGGGRDRSADLRVMNP